MTEPFTISVLNKDLNQEMPESAILRSAAPGSRQKSLARVGRTEFTEDQVALLKRTIAKGADNDELALFLIQCRRTGLDPFAKQIYLVKRWNNKEQRDVMTIQVGIDGYRLIAERTGAYAGNDDPIFDDEAAPQKATVTIYKIVNGERYPFTASARWTQYYPGDKLGFMWKKMPHVMLGKCAEALALRKAFPAELSGLYIAEEFEQARVEGLDDQAEAISPENIGELNDLILACEAAGGPVDLQRFCAIFGKDVERLDQIPITALGLARHELNRKLDSLKKKAEKPKE